MQVTAQGKTPKMKSSVSITVNILNVNDNGPQFEHPSYTAQVPENSLAGYEIVTLTVRKPWDNKASCP